MAGEAHWNEEAKALIAGLILHIAAQEPRERRNLATLRDYLTLAPEAFSTLLKDMQASPEAAGLVARAANRHLGKSDLSPFLMCYVAAIATEPLFDRCNLPLLLNCEPSESC
jgi:type IV secretory pathway TraG/TraD family ATPase VirD4